MRRRPVLEPSTRAGSYARRLAWLSLLVTAFALLLVRDPRAEAGPALAALAAGPALALLAVGLALAVAIPVAARLLRQTPVAPAPGGAS